MEVFIEKYNGEFRNAATYSAYYGFDALGASLTFFPEILLIDQPITKETPVVGSIRLVKKALTQVGAPLPPLLDYPEELRSYLNREVEATTFGEIRKKWKRVFAKPLDDHKRFTGCLFEHYYNTENLEDELKVWTSDPITFDVEYRCFVHKKELVGVHYYKGDFSKYIDTNVVQQAIKDFKNAPVAYSLDFGLVRGTTTLVEVNDGYALGCYGLSPVKYAKMIADRWLEMSYAP